MSNIHSFVETVKLPSISDVFRALIKSLHDENDSILEVRDLIGSDPALSARLLRLASCRRSSAWAPCSIWPVWTR